MIINGDHISIFGASLTGKTTFAKELIKNINCTNVVWIDFIMTSNREISDLYEQNRYTKSIIVFDNFYLSSNAKPTQLFKQNKLHTIIYIMDYIRTINFNLYDIIFFSKTFDPRILNLISDNFDENISYENLHESMSLLKPYGFLYKRINKPENLYLSDGEVYHKRKK